MTSIKAHRAVIALFCTLSALAATPPDLRTADFALILNNPSRSEQNAATPSAINAEQQSLRGHWDSAEVTSAITRRLADHCEVCLPNPFLQISA